MNKIGYSASNHYFLLGSRFDTTVANKIGLIHEVVNDETALDAKVQELSKELYTASPAAVKATKLLIQKVHSMNGNEQTTTTTSNSTISAAIKTYVTGLIARLRISTEGQEGITSFLNKKKPNWIKQSLKK